MGLRKDFLAHKRKTIESFRFVREDILGINLNIEHMNSTLQPVQLGVSKLEENILKMKGMLEKCSSDVDNQQTNNLSIEAKVDNVCKSVEIISGEVSSFRNKIRNISSKSQTLSRKINFQNKSVKKLLPRSKKQSIRIRQLNSALRVSQEDVRKLKKFINGGLRTAKRRCAELEETVKKQRSRILALNRKIEGRKVTRKTAKRITKRAPKKTITTVKTPKKTVKKTITPKKIVTETTTPKTKTVTEVKK